MVLAIAGWGLALVAVARAVVLWRRLALVACASHELRGPATAFELAVSALRREPGGSRRARSLETQLERMRAGLDDLEAARSGRRAEGRPVVLPVERFLRSAAAGRRLPVRWAAGAALVRSDRGRLAQLLCNLVDNAVEHGAEPVELYAVRAGPNLRIEVRDAGGNGSARPAPGRGRGLGIAARAAAEAGGQVVLERTAAGTTAAVELPLADS